MDLPGPPALRQLLDHAMSGPETAASLNGLATMLEAESGPTVAPTIRASIERSRRVVYRGQSFRQTGLFELRLGLIYMDNQHHRLAAEQFELAIVQWQLADDGYLVGLANLAAGLAFHHAFEYEDALDHYQQVHDWLAELQVGRSLPEWRGRDDERDQFLERMSKVLSAASSDLQVRLERLSSQRSVPMQEAAAPIIDAALSDPKLVRASSERFVVHFGVSAPLAIDELRDNILATLEAIERIDGALALLHDRTGIGMRVEKLEIAGRARAQIIGHLPATAVFLRRALSEVGSGIPDGVGSGDAGPAVHYGEARADAPPEIKGDESLPVARRLVRLSAPVSISQERIEATAWRLLPALRQLVKLRSKKIGLSITVDEEKG